MRVKWIIFVIIFVFQIKIIAGIGISFPGIVDSENKIVIATNDKYNEAIDFNWKAWIWSKYNNCDFYIDNDARLACIG